MSERPKVLVIDDEPGVRELISEALSLSEITAVQAADGLEALSFLRRERFDLLILDINMPKLDGLALLEKLRTEGMSVPVLMFSARADKADINQGLRTGADDYLTKPFSIEELVLRVKAIMRRSKGEVAEVKVLTCGPISMDFSKYSANPFVLDDLIGNITDTSNFSIVYIFIFFILLGLVYLIVLQKSLILFEGIRQKEKSHFFQNQFLCLIHLQLLTLIRTFFH